MSRQAIRNLWILFLVFFTLCLFPLITQAAVIYVDSDAVGDNDGSLWANAYTSLQSALGVAGSGDEIWVAKGTYYPTSDYGLGGGARFYHFRMINGVAIYGGFAGTESAVSERTDFLFGGTNESILSGDIGTQSAYSDNCYHVFYHPNGLGLTSSAILDGFTITYGSANGSDPHNMGSGMYNYSSSPTIINCTFSSNRAYNGGGMYNYSSSPTITNSTFSSNFGNTIYGGGMYNDSYSSPSLTNCIFKSNSAQEGGGMYNYDHSSPSIINCCFTSNSVNSSAGEGGGMKNDNWSLPTLTNCTFTSNSAGYGGGMYNYWSSSPNLTNCIIWGNEAGFGDEFWIFNGTTTVNYCCYATGSENIVNHGTFSAPTGNIAGDPQFVGSVNNAAHPYSIGGISPCADAGNNSANSALYDIRGGSFPRKLNKLTGEAGTIDMGAYEYKVGVDASLPVELSAFSAEAFIDGLLLKWTTESEVDNLGFILERQNTGESAWQQIASFQTHDALMGQGNTSSRTEYEFKDESVLPGETYSYRLSDVDIQGNVNIYDVISISLDPLPEETLLESAFPNPFNPKTKISYHLAESGRVQIVVYDMLGRKVNTLLNEEQTAGSYKIYWHGKDDFGKQTSSGTYILRMIAGDVVKSQKVLLMR